MQIDFPVANTGAHVETYYMNNNSIQNSSRTSVTPCKIGKSIGKYVEKVNQKQIGTTKYKIIVSIP